MTSSSLLFVAIVDYAEERNPDFSVFHSYGVVVTDDAGHSWKVRRRFSDFYALHDRLKKRVLPFVSQREYISYFPFPSRLRGRGVTLTRKDDVCKERCEKAYDSVPTRDVHLSHTSPMLQTIFAS